MKTKMSKKSTITVTILACLLAVAVATTIVLAAFSANKTATTTVRFANGVQIKIIGAYFAEAESESPNRPAGTADPIGRTSPVTLLWACTETSQTRNTTSDELTDVSNTVTFDAISFENGPALAQDGSNADVASANAYFIARPSITCTLPASPTAAQTAAANAAMATALSNVTTSPGNGWIAIGSTGWYAYSTDSTNITASTSSLTGATFTTVAPSATVPFLASAQLTSDPIDNLAGATFVATIEIYAVNAAAGDAVDALNAKVFPSSP